MKRKLFCTAYIFAILFVGHADAQLFSGDGTAKDSTLPKVEFGVKAGVNMQSISGNVWDQDYQAGPCGGFFVRMFKNKVGGRAEVLVSSTKYSSPVITDTFGNKGSFRATHIEVPVLFEYSIVPKFVVSAGMQYTNLLTIKNLTNIPGDIKKLFKQGEFSGVIGIEGKLPYNLSVGARYRYGLSDINNAAVSGLPGSWSTSAIQLFVCYKIK